MAFLYLIRIKKTLIFANKQNKISFVKFFFESGIDFNINPAYSQMLIITSAS